MKITPIPPYPFHTISLDVVGRLPVSSCGFTNILVFQDVVIQWFEFTPMSDAKTETMINITIQYFLRYGAPSRILTDCGSIFMSKLFKQLCHLCHPPHELNTIPSNS
jgi:hypothetical protein